MRKGERAMGCEVCPRKCDVDRERGELGFCKAPHTFRVARIALHAWEEPSISGTRGSGTVFFSGCNLRCVFCQNYDVSHVSMGWDITDEELENAMMDLAQQGAHNINLVTPTPYAQRLIPLLTRIKPKLKIPIVYNCGGYESVDALRRLEGLVDIYLPDFKYSSAERAKSYSQAEDYPTVALDAIAEMLRQTGECIFDENGILQRGTVVRHLVLPAGRKDSVRALEMLYERFGNRAFLLSLMSQYTPEFAKSCPYQELHRRVTSFEYESVLKEAQRLDLDGYFQARSAASADYTPIFEGTPLDRTQYRK